MRLLVLLTLAYLAWDNLTWFLDTIEEPSEEERALMSYGELLDAQRAKGHAFLHVAASFTGLLAAVLAP